MPVYLKSTAPARHSVATIRIWIASSAFGLVSIACGGAQGSSNAPPPSGQEDNTALVSPKAKRSPATSSLQPDADSQTAVEPSPPAGVVLPAVGRSREVLGGTGKTAYYWKAVYEVAPDDPAIISALASDDALPGWDAGDAALHLYESQIEAAGLELTRGPGTTMYYPIGDLVVTASSGSQFHLNDPTGFTIFVGPAGG